MWELPEDTYHSLSSELRCFPSVFLAFYKNCRNRFCLESLNLFLEVEEYKSLPHLQRIRKEVEIFTRYINMSSEEEVNISFQVRSRINSLIGQGKVNTFAEAQASCLLLIYHELWVDWKNSPEYTTALLKKVKRDHTLEKSLKETLDPHVFPAALWMFLYRRQNPNIDFELLEACLTGNMRSVIRTIKMGADVNYCSENFGTPLIIAIKHSNLDLVVVLLENPSIDVNLPDIGGQTPIIVASKMTHNNEIQKSINFVIAKLIISTNKVLVNKEDQGGSTALVYSTILENIDFVSLLIAGGADVNMKQYSGNTALHYAVASNNQELVKYLIDKGAKCRKNTNGKTPPDFATIQEIKDMLVSEGSLTTISESIGDGIGGLKKYLTIKKPYHQYSLPF